MKAKPPSIVTIAIMTLITVVFWTFFSVFRIFTATSPTEVPEEVLTPVDATLDQEALNALETRNHLEPHEIPEIVYSTPEPVSQESETENLLEPTPTSGETPLPESTPSTPPQNETIEDLLQGS